MRETRKPPHVVKQHTPGWNPIDGGGPRLPRCNAVRGFCECHTAKGHEGDHVCGDCGEPWDGSFDQRRPCAKCGELTMLDGTDDDKCIDCLFIEDEERATPAPRAPETETAARAASPETER